jgi:hypothetical protein
LLHLADAVSDKFLSPGIEIDGGSAEGEMVRKGGGINVASEWTSQGNWDVQGDSASLQNAQGDERRQQQKLLLELVSTGAPLDMDSANIGYSVFNCLCPSLPCPLHLFSEDINVVRAREAVIVEIAPPDPLANVEDMAMNLQHQLDDSNSLLRHTFPTLTVDQCKIELRSLGINQLIPNGMSHNAAVPGTSRNVIGSAQHFQDNAVEPPMRMESAREAVVLPAQFQDDLGCESVVLVEGADKMQPNDMGSFTKAKIPPTVEQAGRPIYESASGRFLHFWAPWQAWRIGSSFTHNAAIGVKSDGGGTDCPTEASGWSVLSQGTWILDYTVSVTAEHRKLAPQLIHITSGMQGHALAHSHAHQDPAVYPVAGDPLASTSPAPTGAHSQAQVQATTPAPPGTIPVPCWLGYKPCGSVSFGTTLKHAMFPDILIPGEKDLAPHLETMQHHMDMMVLFLSVCLAIFIVARILNIPKGMTPCFMQFRFVFSEEYREYFVSKHFSDLIKWRVKIDEMNCNDIGQSGKCGTKKDGAFWKGYQDMMTKMPARRPQRSARAPPQGADSESDRDEDGVERDNMSPEDKFYKIKEEFKHKVRSKRDPHSESFYCPGNIYRLLAMFPPWHKDTHTKEWIPWLTRAMMSLVMQITVPALIIVKGFHDWEMPGAKAPLWYLYYPERAWALFSLVPLFGILTAMAITNVVHGAKANYVILRMRDPDTGPDYQFVLNIYQWFWCCLSMSVNISMSIMLQMAFFVSIATFEGDMISATGKAVALYFVFDLDKKIFDGNRELKASYRAEVRHLSKKEKSSPEAPHPAGYLFDAAGYASWLLQLMSPVYVYLLFFMAFKSRETGHVIGGNPW